MAKSAVFMTWVGAVRQLRTGLSLPQIREPIRNKVDATRQVDVPRFSAAPGIVRLNEVGRSNAPILLQIGQSSLYFLANSQTPIFKTNPNPQTTIVNQFNLAMPLMVFMVVFSTRRGPAVHARPQAHS